jgi:8-oxo-dGTP diphosphatase
MTRPPVVRRSLRVSAYAVCARDGEVLLARFVGPPPLWTLPGGGVEHGEDPAETVLRELTEETGYQGRLVRLLGIDSARHRFQREYGEEDQHALRIVYEVALAGGALSSEVGGSTDLAGWFDLDAVSELERSRLVDIGLSMRVSARGAP